MFDLSDRFETTDGSRPDASALGEAAGKKHPLVALSILAGGDAFESANAKPPADGPARALEYVDAKIDIERHGGSEAHAAYVKAEIARLIAANLQLIARLQDAKPIKVDLVPPGVHMSKLGYPRASSVNAAGLFWDHKTWDRAHIALRQEYLDTDRALVVHEMGHAVHYIAFTQKERDLTYKVLRPSFGSRAAMDEVFAIYTEREMQAGAFLANEKRAPGVYGFTRRQWDENHLFTRFVRKLYAPHRPLAGHKTAQQGGAAWKKFSGG